MAEQARSAIMDRLDAGLRDRVRKTARLIVTPHCSADDHTVYIDRCPDIFLEDFERYLSGRTLQNLVDPKRGY